MAEQEHKKSRPFYIAEYLRAKSDDMHWVKQGEIMDYLYETYEIMPDRKTIKRDIAMLRDDFGMDIEEEPYYGYRLCSREFELDDLKILAECVHAAKFISEARTNDLIDVLCDFCSDYQAKQLKREVYLCDRVKTTQNKTLHVLNTIREAMQRQFSPSPYIRGRKISFRYMTHSISDANKVIEGDNGKVHKVSPYALVISNGDYYMIGLDDETAEIQHYRIDWMRDAQLLEEGRNLSKQYLTRNMKSYIRRTFSMAIDKPTKVEIRFDNSLLDAVIDKFGEGFGAEYRKDGKSHFVVTVEVEVCDQFFAWMCSFGKKAKILGPGTVADAYLNHLNTICRLYEE